MADPGGKHLLDNSNFKAAVSDYRSGDDAKSAAVQALYGNDINTWDVSAVSDMRMAFSGDTTFNESLNCCDMSSVTNAAHMFCGAAAFNQPIGNWNMSSVTSTLGMFYEAAAFNQPIETWDISSVTTTYLMEHVFCHQYGIHVLWGSCFQPSHWKLGHVCHQHFGHVLSG